MEPSESPFQRRMRQKRKANRRLDIALVVGILVMLLAFGVYFLFRFETMQKTYLYPYPYREIVEQYAEEYHMDSTLVAAVIMTESKFKNDAQSHRGAVGLMQIMPSTAKWIADQIGDLDYTEERLHDPAVNICYGTWYLSSLEDEFDGNEILMLAAYNAGRGNVQSWIKENGWTKDFQDVSAIPYAETRHYVTNVLKNWEKYRILYQSSPGTVPPAEDEENQANGEADE